MIRNSILVLTYFFISLSAYAYATEPNSVEEIEEIVFIETEEEIALPFDTALFLPEGFDAYNTLVSIQTINFMEDDSIELGFDSTAYLPNQFNPHN